MVTKNLLIWILASVIMSIPEGNGKFQTGNFTVILMESQ